MYRLIVILTVFISLLSCSKTTTTEQKNETTTLAFIQEDKKMVKVDGGFYKPFVGNQDSLVEVQSFYIDETAVTNREYIKFLKANPQWTKDQVKRIYADSTYLKHWTSNYEIPKGVSLDAPVTNVSWFAAKAYAKSVGKRLPTIDEWEYTARADEQMKDATEDPAFTQRILQLYQNKMSYTKPVKQFSPNAWGVYDLYGLIWEWTDDFNSVMLSGESRKDNTVNETLFCAGASVTSSDLKNYAAFIRFALRGSIEANYTVNNLGFRCAKDIN